MNEYFAAFPDFLDCLLRYRTFQYVFVVVNTQKMLFRAQTKGPGITIRSCMSKALYFKTEPEGHVLMTCGSQPSIF